MLPGLDRCLLRAITGVGWADLEVGWVFQAVTPVETVAAHNLHCPSALRREAMVATTCSDATEVYGQPGFVQRSARLICAINPAPRTTTSVASAAIDSALLGLRAKCTVDARSKATFTHLAHGRVESHARIVIERIEAVVSQRTGACMNIAETKVEDVHTDDEHWAEKGELGFAVQHRRPVIVGV